VISKGHWGKRQADDCELRSVEFVFCGRGADGHRGRSRTACRFAIGALRQNEDQIALTVALPGRLSPGCHGFEVLRIVFHLMGLGDAEILKGKCGQTVSLTLGFCFIRNWKMASSDGMKGLTTRYRFKLFYPHLKSLRGRTKTWAIHRSRCQISSNHGFFNLLNIDFLCAQRKA
jgi:hypothetical protein